ncbi:divalent-cation tolerance protein CutA [Candidatus Similichlamydia laticola]|uniref:Periplasmic divalent cation tolerance protein CutA n=1 Tax=Candidatus Similichlamydia laticola TaxID=2170265 RepID=A0A369KAM1_9BACT|nr:divalent-cation tolerance protein CutA [Candidatus Similichlamydia laticola]RDB31651.1 Periplasmic divalent cation tolerance protein CutA [Candidatus Similichlamydia laticola]
MLSWVKNLFSKKGEEAAVYLFVTLPARDVAVVLIRELLGSHLIACASLFPVTSLFFWEGQVVEEEEWKLLLKSRQSLFKAINAKIREKSPYSITEVSLLQVEKMDHLYRDWLFSMTTWKEG